MPACYINLREFQQLLAISTHIKKTCNFDTHKTVYNTAYLSLVSQQQAIFVLYMHWHHCNIKNMILNMTCHLWAKVSVLNGTAAFFHNYKPSRLGQQHFITGNIQYPTEIKREEPIKLHIHISVQIGYMVADRSICLKKLSICQNQSSSTNHTTRNKAHTCWCWAHLNCQCRSLMKHLHATYAQHRKQSYLW